MTAANITPALAGAAAVVAAACAAAQPAAAVTLAAAALALTLATAGGAVAVDFARPIADAAAQPATATTLAAAALVAAAYPALSDDPLHCHISLCSRPIMRCRPSHAVNSCAFWLVRLGH